MAPPRDVLIIGGGHNGLVAAFYLARAGWKPLVLERRPVAGGAALTEEFAPGFRCSTLAHRAGPLAREVSRDMRLERFGLEWLEPQTRLFAPTPEGRALVLSREAPQSREAISRFSSKDAGKFGEFERVLGALSTFLGEWMLRTPPAVEAAAAGDLWRLAMAGRKLRGLGRKEMYSLLRWVPMPVADFAAEWFESEPLRASVACEGVFGTFLGPRSAGSTAVLLLRAAAAGNGAGASTFVRGGLGALSRALAASAEKEGAEIRTDADVASISVKDRRAVGVTLASGEEIAARAVVSNADPKRTFLRLVGPQNLEPSFVTRIEHYRSMGAVAKVNLALDALPGFTALKNGSDAAQALSGRILVAPETDYLERAFDDAKYGAWSREPFVEIAIPTIMDPALAPAGKHVMSIVVQYAPYKLREGNWRMQREALADAVLKTISAYAPNLPSLVLHRQVITPEDLEAEFSLTGGHIYHGELALDQLFAMRPLLGWAHYRTPIEGLYLCGSGTHPGTGLTGLCGRNAAREVLKDLKNR